MTPALPEIGDFRLPTFEEYLSGRPPEPGAITAPYAHPIDRAIIERLSRSMLQYPVNRVLDWVLGYLLTPALVNSIPVASRSFPRLSEARARAASTLGIPIPDMFVAAQPGIGVVFTTGTDEHNLIFIDSTYATLAKPEELLFVVGHESGHIHNQHVTYHTLGVLILSTGESVGLLSRNPVVTAVTRALQFLMAPTLAAWMRRSEITADRAGLICCRDLEASQRALVRVILGFAPDTEVDTEDYLRTSRELPLSGMTARYALLETTHPMIPVRLQALQLFHDSELYYDVTGEPRPNRRLLPREELEGRVGELIAIL